MRLYELTKFKRNAIDQELPFDDEHVERAHKGRLDKESWRGPHEGRVLTLMIKGLKPAALLDVYDMEKWKPYIKQYGLVSGQFTFDWHGTPITQFVVTQPGQEWRIKRIAKLFVDKEHQKNIDLYHARLGMLLGYSNEDIRRFIQAVR